MTAPPPIGNPTENLISENGFPHCAEIPCPNFENERSHSMTQIKENETDGLMTVRDVCTEYDLSRSRVVNIIVKIPIKLQKHRANWYAIEDVQELMEEYWYMWND